MTLSDAGGAGCSGSEYQEPSRRREIPVPDAVRAGAEEALEELSMCRGSILASSGHDVAYWLGRLEGTVRSFLIATEPVP